MVNEEMAQYLGLFLTEANEQLEVLEQAILTLEHNATPKLLQEIFRAAHTIKGSSRAMGFTSMGELTHALEDVFDKLRCDELAVTPAVVEALFDGLDLLKRLKEEIAETGESVTETHVQTARLRAVMGQDEGQNSEVGSREAESATSDSRLPTSEFCHAPLSETALMAVQEARLAGCDVYALTIYTAQDCAMKSVRAIMTLQALETIGSVLATTPDEEALENEEFASAFGVVLATEHPAEEVSRIVNQIAEITRVMLQVYGQSVAAPASDSPPPMKTADFVHAPLCEAARTAAQEAERTGCRLYALTVRLADDCLMKCVRALMVLQAVEALGSILATTPDEESLENEAFDSHFGFVLATTHSVEEIERAIKQIAEITDLVVTPQAGESTEGRPTTETQSSVLSPQSSVLSPPVLPEEERQADRGPEARGKSSADPEVLAAKKGTAVTQNQTVRVDVSRLDNLLNLVGELIIDQTRIAQLTGQMEGKYANELLLENLNEAAAHFGRITSEMQKEIMKARMLPVDTVFNRFPRMIRDLAQKMGKEIDFVVTGRETELDRSVIEVIGDPLIHLLRNSVDHGIEQPEDRIAAGKSGKGTVWLRARHEENYIVIEIEDDGRGMNPEKLRSKAVEKGIVTPEAGAHLSDREAVNLIFASGFSTAEAVTDVSGRGVGMDIVKSNLTRFGAILDLDSKLGQGSKFTIKLPLTLAIIRGLLVRVASGVYAMPLASVVETIRVPASRIHVVNHREVIVQRGMTLPLVRLQKLFYGAWEGDSPPETGNVMHYVVVVGVAERQVGLVVESLLGEQEIVIKSLGKFVGDVRGISGATILGDGRIALIVDVNGLLAIATEEKVGVYVR